MIGLIVQMLSIDDHYNASDDIDIAKGKYKIPLTFKEGWKQRKRWHKQ